MTDGQMQIRMLLATSAKMCESQRLACNLALAELRELSALALGAIVSPRLRTAVLERGKLAEARLGEVQKAVEERAATLERLAAKVGR